MMKKNLYFFQVNYPYGKSAHIPYTAGQLLAYAFEDEAIKESYILKKIFFLREDIKKVMLQIEEPSVVAFSTYIWNYNYNRTLAKLIKEKYPGCMIIFGGHHVSPGGSLLENNAYIDYLIHGEGENSFRKLLRSLAGKEAVEEIPGVSFRAGESVVTNPEKISSECNFPSPYLNGYFDDIIRENPDLDFMALIETSRGCPNSCAYCDWSNMKSKIRKFPLERIYGEIEWVMKNKVYGLGSADSNFGMFSRDEEITDKIIEAKKKSGYPIGFQTSYAKNSSKTVFNIGMKLEKSGMNKGITLSFQSMSKEVLKNIGRENISVEYYSELMRLYNEAGIATYTELILGLPGETYESWINGINQLLTLGQHNSIYIHNCEWLPCSIMGKPDYIEFYKIKTSRIPLNQPHREPDDGDNIQEWSQIVTSTCSMDADEWKKMNLFSYVVQSFHHMGILQFFALYLYDSGVCSYREFYTLLLEFFLSGDGLFVSTLFEKISGCLDDVLKEKGTLSISDQRFGKVQWPFEEYIYLCTIYELDKFYDEVVPFLKSFKIPEEVFDDLFNFQKKMMKKPFDEDFCFESSYNFLEYFNNLLNGKATALLNTCEKVSVTVKKFENWEMFAKTVAWYGRKDSNSTYIKTALSDKRE